MRCDAGLASADDGERARVAADRRAAAAGLALVARLVRVIEIRAARALEEVAGGRRLVAQLPRGAGEEGARQEQIVLSHARIGGEVGVAHERSDSQAAVPCRLDLV